MTSKKVKPLAELIKDLASSSVLADSIVQRLSSHSRDIDLPDTVESLRSEIVRLQAALATSNQIIRVLQSYAVIDDEQWYSDEEEQSFSESMNKIVSQMSLANLKFGYTTKVLMAYPVRIRYLIALALVNSCTVRGLQPIPIWQEIVTKQGVI